jgi:hypothetical protein
MYRERHATLPPLPRNLAAITIPQTYAQTTTGQAFLLAQGANNEFLSFATQENLRIMCSKYDIYMDGTFDTAPSLYSQLYTVHVFVGQRMVPVVYILMSNKTTILYISVFESLKNECTRSGLTFHPQTVMTDFESGIIPAIQQCFPWAQHKGCHFHFSQVYKHYIE